MKILKSIYHFLTLPFLPKEGKYSTIDVCKSCEKSLSFDEMFNCCEKCGNLGTGVNINYKPIKVRYSRECRQWIPAANYPPIQF